MPLVSRPTWRRATLLLALAVSCAAVVLAEAVAHNATARTPVSAMSLQEFEEEVQSCPIVQELSTHLYGDVSSSPPPSSLMSRLFAVLFPGSPAVNALLATLYISGPPNLLLALCPPDIDPASLSVMVAFAVGGLLGDTLFHLLPEIFLGGDEGAASGKVRMVLVEPNRNLLLGVAILAGFVTFVAMDKGLRIATGGAAHDHAHGHAGGHGHEHDHASTGKEKTTASSSALDSTAANGARHRADKKKAVNGSASSDLTATKQEHGEEASASVKLGGYLNLIADFTHNITDGLAMSASFYASPTVGATTAVAVFFHEIPHEVGDFALLVQSGFSKRAAMGAQFVTALGALLGTCIGIAVQELGGAGAAAATSSGASGGGMKGGLFGTSLTWGDMLLPFTAGTFLYVGTVAVIPELLETTGSKGAELRKTLVQFAAIAVGAGIMLYISWHD